DHDVEVPTGLDAQSRQALGKGERVDSLYAISPRHRDGRLVALYGADDMNGGASLSQRGTLDRELLKTVLADEPAPRVHDGYRSSRVERLRGHQHLGPRTGSTARSLGHVNARANLVEPRAVVPSRGSR